MISTTDTHISESECVWKCVKLRVHLKSTVQTNEETMMDQAHNEWQWHTRWKVKHSYFCCCLLTEQETVSNTVDTHMHTPILIQQSSNGGEIKEHSCAGGLVLRREGVGSSCAIERGVQKVWATDS